MAEIDEVELEVIEIDGEEILKKNINKDQVKRLIKTGYLKIGPPPSKKYSADV